MFEITPQQWTQVAPSVKALLAEFHSGTRAKLGRAPTGSGALYENQDGVLVGR